MPCIGGRLLICSPVRLSPAIGVMSGAHYRRLLIFFMLYPRTHEVLGWGRGNTYAKKQENRCPRNSRYSRALKILIIKPKPRVRQADRMDQRQSLLRRPLPSLSPQIENLRGPHKLINYGFNQKFYAF